MAFIAWLAIRYIKFSINNFKIIVNSVQIYNQLFMDKYTDATLSDSGPGGLYTQHDITEL